MRKMYIESMLYSQLIIDDENKFGDKVSAKD